MSSVLTAERLPERLFDHRELEVSLDEAVADAWERLTTGRPTQCLVCGAPVRPEYERKRGLRGGRCVECGSTLT